MCGVPAQLAEVYWVEGLGPDKELWMAEPDHGACADLGSPDTLTGAAGAGTHSRHSFADQVSDGGGQPNSCHLTQSAWVTVTDTWW